MEDLRRILRTNRIGTTVRRQNRSMLRERNIENLVRKKTRLRMMIEKKRVTMIRKLEAEIRVRKMKNSEKMS